MRYARTLCVALPMFVSLAACSSSSSKASARDIASTTTVVAKRTTAPGARISGPVTGGKAMSLLASPETDLADHGYEQSEWLASGTATTYSANHATGRRVPYRTRVLSFVPKSSAFNGTVIVEWLNVTTGFDLANDLAYLSPELERSGYAWVGVSAQKVGVDNLVTNDPARYGSLKHPGDAYSLDIFNQAALAARNGDLTPIARLHPKHFLAAGQSQSAWALTTYINTVQPVSHTFDGFFVHSRGGGAMSLDGIAAPNAFSTGATVVRRDVDAPVLLFETETDEQVGNYFRARQPDTDRIRLWDIAGASHEDSYRVPSASVVGCKGNVNEAPTHYVAEAALHALDQWVATGAAPPTAPRLTVNVTNGTPVVQRDSRGIAIGGIRNPAIEVPVAAYSGIGTDHSSVNCELIGDTQPFSTAMLHRLYPTRAGFIKAFTTATDRAISAGYVLPADRAGMLAFASRAHL